MWKNALPVLSKTLTESLVKQQIRTTYILRRKFPVNLHKKNQPPKPLRSRHYVYELVKDTTTEKDPEIDVILTSYVEGLGNAGEKVSVKSGHAYNKLLLPGLAVYASPENLEKYKDKIESSATAERYSSPNALVIMKILSQVCLSVVMNKEHPWTIQPWHIKTSFRKCGYAVPEEAITLPKIPIKGPDMNLENEEFFVTVTINKTEEVNVRCRLHHWSTNIVERIPHTEKFWEQPSEPIHPDFEKVLNEIPVKNAKSTVKSL